MEKRQGVFIVLEGTDGSGKGTQFKLLADFLRAQGYDLETFDFPQYDQPSSYYVKEYLNGAYGTADQVGPYTASLFYALDRYQAAPKIQAALSQGKVVLSNRFTGSSMGHQGTKFRNAEERRGYFIWLDNLEFEMLKIPRPDVSLVLRVPADIAQSLVDQKQERSYTDKKRDIHEADLSHLERAVAVYDDLCQLFPKDFARIDCVRSGQLMPVEAVQEIVRQKVMPLLPPPARPATAQTDRAYIVPEQLDSQAQAAYRSHIDEILRLHGSMLKTLETSAQAAGSQDQAAVRLALLAVLPVATVPDLQLRKPSAALSQAADDVVPKNHTGDHTTLQLVQATPRNEFDLLPTALYPESNVPLTTLKTHIADWPYETKLRAFETYLKNSSGILDQVQYTWDLLGSFEIIHMLQTDEPTARVTAQALTPRYGFAVPEVIDQANLTEPFERCFQISLQLHSLLQTNGYEFEAQYATLRGHLQRCSINLSAKNLMDLQTRQNANIKKLARGMLDKLAETHPIIAEKITA